MPKQTSLQELFLEDIRDLFDAEKQLVRALPKMAKSASDSELETALREHLEQTKGQVERLEQVFEMMDAKPRGKPCQGMKGIVEEGQEVMQGEQSGAMMDAAIAGAGRKVEHYEMAGYESARAIAQQLGMRDAVQLLQATLQEELQADRTLAQISKRLVKEASRGGTAMRGEEEEQQRGGGRRGGNARGSEQRQSSGARSSGGRHSSSATTDHEEIRRWAEERGARPTCVKGTGGRGDTGMIRLDFPGYTGEESLQDISWDDWFEKFDENNLALLYQEKTAGGQKSNFNKLVSRETAEGQQKRKPKARAAR
jgi:ferritin-like metal-binding protein YciE